MKRTDFGSGDGLLRGATGSRAARWRGAGVSAGLLLLMLLLVVPAVAAANPATDDAQARALEAAMQHERAMLAWRLLLAALGLVLVTLPLVMKAESARRIGAVRSTLLAVVALASIASFYEFFGEKRGVGFKDTDVFHYYMGSKYFSEVGHFDLYHCTLMALIESGVESRFDLPPVRDQRTLRFHTPDTALAAARQCRAQFDDTRWRAFAHDVAWFNHRFAKLHWRATFHDHGYNPTPVWTALGGALTSRVAVGSPGFHALIDADRALVVLALFAIFWAVGFESAVVAAILWGTGTHWGYGWIGDSLLRNLWMFGVVVGLSLLYRKRDAAGGVLLALSSWLRLFPGIFIAAFLAGALRRGSSDPEMKDRFVKAALGVAGASVFLLVWAATATSFGVAAFAEFYEKMSVFAVHESLNKLGLHSLVWRSIMTGAGHLTTNAEGTAILTSWSPAWLPFAVRGGQLLLLVPGLYWFWRIAGRAQPHETAAASFALIPLLTDPANYYYVFFLCGTLLAATRPALRVALLLAGAAWLANALLFYREPAEYLGASVIAVALPVFFLYRLSRESETNEALAR